MWASAESRGSRHSGTNGLGTKRSYRQWMPSLALGCEVAKLPMQRQPLIRLTSSIEVCAQSVVSLYERSVVQTGDVHACNAMPSPVRCRGYGGPRINVGVSRPSHNHWLTSPRRLTGAYPYRSKAAAMIRLRALWRESGERVLREPLICLAVNDIRRVESFRASGSWIRGNVALPIGREVNRGTMFLTYTWLVV